MAKTNKPRNVTLKKTTKTVAAKSRTQTAQKKKHAAGTKVKAVRGKAASISGKSTATAKSSVKKSPVVKKATVSPKKAATPTRTRGTVTTVVSRSTKAKPKPRVAIPSKTPPVTRTERKVFSTEELRDILLHRRKGIMENFDGDIDTTNETKLHKIVGDVADIAQESSEKELTFQLAEVESRELVQIDNALERIAEGMYGMCEKCGEAISQARLKALPFAGKCIRCQEEDEAMQNEM